MRIHIIKIRILHMSNADGKDIIGKAIDKSLREFCLNVSPLRLGVLF